MAQNADDQKRSESAQDAQLRALTSLFNWLVGEVVTARIMILRLAGDLVRTGALDVDEINGTPLTAEIIDSVMSNFPQDSLWQPLQQRLRTSLEALRAMDLRAQPGLDDDEDLEGDAGDEEDAAAEERQVLYSNEEHDLSIPPAYRPTIPAKNRN